MNKQNNQVTSTINQSSVELGIENILRKNIALLPDSNIIDRIKTSAGLYIYNRRDLLELNNTAKMQMLNGVLKEAMLGLEAGVDYDIVPFKGKPTICRKKEGYFKIIDMIKPAEIVRFVNNVVTTGDNYSFNPVTGELKHEMHGERYQDFEHILGSYAYIKFANGFEATVFLTKEDLEQIKNTSPSGKSEYSPWNSQSLKMVKTKTVKELAKELCTLWSNKLNSTLFSAVNSDEVSVKVVNSQGYIENDNTIYNQQVEDKKEETQQEEQVDEVKIVTLDELQNN